jgi:hypothetical protein
LLSESCLLLKSCFYWNHGGKLDTPRDSVHLGACFQSRQSLESALLKNPHTKCWQPLHLLLIFFSKPPSIFRPLLSIASTHDAQLKQRFELCNQEMIVVSLRIRGLQSMLLLHFVDKGSDNCLFDVQRCIFSLREYGSCSASSRAFAMASDLRVRMGSSAS